MKYRQTIDDDVIFRDMLHNVRNFQKIESIYINNARNDDILINNNIFKKHLSMNDILYFDQSLFQLFVDFLFLFHFLAKFVFIIQNF